ncbi:MAG TPA: M28 family peptidase [Terriglobales bacterium]|nr:M28 family peptidase [Terriglobales bacterium]
MRVKAQGRSLLLTFAVLLTCTPPSLAADRISYSQAPRSAISDRLQRYTGDDKQREATLKQMFEEAGCDGQYLLEQTVKGSKQPNIECSLPGIGPRVIIVGAHFDHVSAGSGVVDNWSGASLLPSLYEALKDKPRTHTYIFVGFTDEERGEVGSKFYARHMDKDAIGATDAMVNLDTLGLAQTEVWASHSDKRLVRALAYVAGLMSLPVKGVDVEQVGTTDSEQFAALKVPSITIHSLTQATWDAHILHTSRDKFSAIQFDDYYQSYQLLAAYLAYLDRPIQTPANGR